MNAPVVLLAYLDREPALQLCHRQRRLGLSRIGALVLWVRPGRSRQQMDAPHERADQAFDVPAVVRRGDWPKDQRDAVLIATSTQGCAREVRAVVGVKRARQAPNRLGAGQRSSLELGFLGQNGVREAQGN